MQDVEEVREEQLTRRVHTGTDFERGLHRARQGNEPVPFVAPGPAPTQAEERAAAGNNYMLYTRTCSVTYTMMTRSYI